MKRALWCSLLAVCICLAGCGQPAPARAADGAAWSGDWISVGNVIGVDTPAGLDPRENNEALAANGMYYATWSIGKEEPYVNADGEDAKIYDAQIYLLLAGFSAAGKAEETVKEWQSMAGEHYVIEDTRTESYNGQDFTVITYAFAGEDNPYARGTSAFGVYRNYAVSVELSCREGFEGDVAAVLASFLESCHYAA